MRLQLLQSGGLVYTLKERVRTSFWAVPSLLSVVALVLAELAIRADQRSYLAESPWLYSGTADGGRAILAALASAMITVTGVVFSITIVALSFASGALGPRLLRNFMRDRVNQLVLGAFIATFLFSLRVLAGLKGAQEPRSSMAITLALLLVVVSFGILIYFIHHVSKSIQVNTILGEVREALDAAIDRLFPDELPEDGEEEELPPPPYDPAAPAWSVPAGASGYVQVVDRERLEKIASEHDAGIVCAVRPGEFAVEGGELLRTTMAVDEELADELRSCIALGPIATEPQDVEYSVRQIVEIALRALSPGVNDPFTAMSGIDHLGASLARLARRRMPERERRTADGRFRLETPGVTFPMVMDSAWSQIRHHGAGQPAVGVRILEALVEVARQARAPERARCVEQHARMVAAACLDGCAAESDRREVERRRARVLALTGSGPAAAFALSGRGAESGRAVGRGAGARPGGGAR